LAETGENNSMKMLFPEIKELDDKANLKMLEIISYIDDLRSN